MSRGILNPVTEIQELSSSETKAAKTTRVLWQIEISPRSGHSDRLAAEVRSDAHDFGLSRSIDVSAAMGFLIQGNLDAADVERLVNLLLVDPVVETARFAICGSNQLVDTTDSAECFFVLPLPGVTDPQAESALGSMKQLGFDVDAVRTFRKYLVSGLPADQRTVLCDKILANDSIEQIVFDSLDLKEIQLAVPYEFQLRHIALSDADDNRLLEISRDWQLSLTLIEMQTVQEHFKPLGRQPTDVELETIAQTWSEHCSHKTLAGRVAYRDEHGEIHYENMLKETIFAATNKIREDLGSDDWCVSVFRDNAGIVHFDEQYNVAFKVETHNRPSALEPYGGANTGIGGVIRDTLGTGMGAKPICSTDVFCFAPPGTNFENLPPGVMHPRSIMKGVVAGVRDYGNRMGIPTVNGAVYFDARYVGNPLVFCGNVGLIPRDKSFKQPAAGDLIVSIGGRTGRDGIHGATFSSAELTDHSDVMSGGAVQIGNAITEKMLMDVLLQARDRDLYNAVTDCGAGGFSSAVGEMGEHIGAEVWLDRAPLKYEGLSYTEIWISEAQERMVCAVPAQKWTDFQSLCESESVEATVIGKFEPTGRLVLKYLDQQVADLDMNFLHHGRPPVIRQAHYSPAAATPLTVGDRSKSRWTGDLLTILGSLNIASKHWIIRQYDHEVQGGSVIKPLVGVDNDGPGDASVVRPVLNSYRGLAIACGMNPYYGDLDPYHMATSSVDEAIRNCVAVGADPDRIAILDNFCWGYTDRPETLGTLVRAARGCHDVSVDFRTPFISGKDSLNNEFSYTDSNGQRTTISIPSTLLISAMGQVEDVRHCVTMDLKSPGNLIYQVGRTLHELGGSHWCLVNNQIGGEVPKLDAKNARQMYLKLHNAMTLGIVRSCHDMSEGGLAVCAAEMAFAGGLGMQLHAELEAANGMEVVMALFSESNSRFLCEISKENAKQFESIMGSDCNRVGIVDNSCQLNIRVNDQVVIESELATLKSAWQQPLDWT